MKVDVPVTLPGSVVKERPEGVAGLQVPCHSGGCFIPSVIFRGYRGLTAGSW